MRRNRMFDSLEADDTVQRGRFRGVPWSIDLSAGIPKIRVGNRNVMVRRDSRGFLKTHAVVGAWRDPRALIARLIDTDPSIRENASRG